MIYKPVLGSSNPRPLTNHCNSSTSVTKQQKHHCCQQTVTLSKAQQAINHQWMCQALQLLTDDKNNIDEVPIAALIINPQGLCIGSGCNQPIQQNDPTAHAEIQAIRQACQQTNNYRLTGCTLYVTLEPCLMCIGALIHARIETIVYAAADPKFGLLSTKKICQFHTAFNHHLSWVEGNMQSEATNLLTEFFQNKRTSQ